MKGKGDNFALVSVIIPNYRHAPYLRERIDSVLAQDYDAFEVIILDDCSPDDSRQIIESYRNHPRVSHIVLNEQNSGSTFAQWNKGFALAQGEYIWIAESDDVAAPTLLSTLVKGLQQHPEASVAYCHSRLIDADGRVLSEQNARNPSPEGKVSVHRSQHFLRYLLLFNYIYNASMAVFRREALQQVDDGYRRYRYCGDWHFWASICATGDVIEVHDMLNSFRQHKAKVTVDSRSDVARRWKDECEVISYIRSLCRLSAIGDRCFRGRLRKRLLRSGMNEEEMASLRLSFPQLCGGTAIDSIAYEIGKTLFGFLRHQQDIRFLRIRHF